VYCAYRRRLPVVAVGLHERQKREKEMRIVSPPDDSVIHYAIFDVSMFAIVSPVARDYCRGDCGSQGAEVDMIAFLDRLISIYWAWNQRRLMRKWRAKFYANMTNEDLYGHWAEGRRK
jgi:hypothetical protein